MTQLDKLAALLDRRDGVISLAQAAAHLTRKTIRHRLATGRWQRVHRSVFVAHNGPVGVDQLRWVAALPVGTDAVVGGITAAQVSGLKG